MAKQVKKMRVRGAGLIDSFIDRDFPQLNFEFTRFKSDDDEDDEFSDNGDQDGDEDLAELAETLADPALNAPRTPLHQYLVYTFVSIAVQLVLGWPYAFPDGGRPHACYQSEEEIEAGLPPPNRRICGLEEVLNAAHFELRFLTAIVLGGYVASTVYLWRLRRTNYVALCGGVRNLLVQISTLIPDAPEGGDVDPACVRRTKIKMTRWAILGYELTVLKARGKMDSNDGRRYLESLGILQCGDEEWNGMVVGDRHTSVWYWIQRKSVSLAERGIIKSEERLQTICAAVTIVRDKADDLMSVIDRDQPLAYTSAVGTTVFFSIHTKILWKGFQWAICFYNTNGGVWTEPRMYVEVLLLFFYTTILALLFDIDQVLYNPFGRRELDIPHRIVGGGLRNLATRLGASVNIFPPSEESRVDEDVSKEDALPESATRVHVNFASVQEDLEYERSQVFGTKKRRSLVGLPGVFGGGSKRFSLVSGSRRFSFGPEVGL